MRPSSIADLETFLRARLREALPGRVVHERFAPRPVAALDIVGQRAGARPAAALILIYPGPSESLVPLTVRDAALPHHGGQISLPGGAIDPGESATATALREADEEIGVAPDEVRVLGSLTPVWIAVSGFLVTPIVGVTDSRPKFRLRAGEVAALVEVPVSHLRDRARVRWGRRERRGVPMDYPFIAVDDHVVWGATAMMLAEFVSLFDPDHGPPPR